MVSQVEFAPDNTINDELEFVANQTLCHVISQLSNLNSLASDMFDNLTSDVIQIKDRSEKLRNHVNVLQAEYKSFKKKKTGETTDIFEEKQEKELLQHFDQQILRPNTRPVAITKLYQTVNQPPAFYKINPFRDDGTDGLTLYTDPNFFFKNWSSEMQQKETKHERSHGREKRQKDEKGPRQIKRKQDILQDRNAGLGPEFDPNFSTEENGKKHKRRRKKKKMDGFSNKQYEKQNKKNASTSHVVGTTIQAGLNYSEHDTCKKDMANGREGTDVPPSVPLRKVQEPEIRPTVPMRNNATISPTVPMRNLATKSPTVPMNNSATIPPTVPMRKHTTTTENRDSIPLPPPPPITDYRDTSNAEITNHSQSGQSANLTDFFPKLIDIDLDLPPPPSPIYNDTSSQRDSNMSNGRFPFPQPPLEQRTSRRSLKQNRISSFISTPLSIRGNNKIYTPSLDNFDIGETPELDNVNIAAPPVMPPPPPAPILPPVITSSSVVPNDAAGMSESQTSTSGLLFDNSSLLEMKKKLVSSKERTLPEIQPTKSDTLDVHSIMMKALEGHRRVKGDSSSDEDSYSSDSDSEWE